MKYAYIVLGLLITLSSCRKQEATAAIDPHLEGMHELRQYESKMERMTEGQPSVFPYSDGHVYRVFELRCIGECFLAEFKNRISRGIEIPKKDFEDLFTLLTDPSSFDKGTAACYYPKFGLVVYDKNNIPSESLSICLDCNNFATIPGTVKLTLKDKSMLGFSKAAREKLRQMFLKWGIDYYGYSTFYDDEEEYNKYLRKKKGASIEDTINN